MHRFSRFSIPPLIPPAALLTVVLLNVAPLSLLAQDSPQSPVFKSYRPPRPGGIVEQSDVTYQLWHTFDLTRRARGGDVPAQQELAVRYLTGRGVKADTARGAYWTLSAAAQNMPPARFNLGILYYNGIGVEWNPFAAYDQFLWCAERGMPEAQYILGTFMMENLVLRRNWTAALRWLGAASDSGYAPARELLESLRRRGEAGAPTWDEPPAPLRRDSVAARAPSATLAWTPVFLDFQADTGTSHDDQVLISDLLHEGSPEELRSAGLGDSSVRFEVTVPGIVEALRRAANAGSPEALTILGRCRERGVGLAADTVEAAACYVRATRLDSPRSPELLLGLLDRPGVMEQLAGRAAGGDPTSSFVLASLVGLRLAQPLLKTGTFLTDGEAARALHRAASAGSVPALLELGVWQYAGRVGAADRRKALRFWEDAARAGSREAEVRLAAAAIESGAPVTDTLTVRLTQAMGEGSVIAQMALGYCREKGWGMERNSGAAARLYRAAAQRGSRDAYRALLRLHDAIRPPGSAFTVPSD